MTAEITPYRKAIVAAFPDLRGSVFRMLPMGWHSLAIDVDDRLIFKFPRSEEAERALRREAGILAAVRPHLTMQVPDLELIEGTMLFSRHAKIQGEHLLHEHYVKLPTGARERLAEELALFYAELHAIAPAKMRDAGAADILPWQSTAAIRTKALPLVPAEHASLCRQTVDAFECLPPDPLGSTYGFFDGHGWNMAFDHAQQRINGVYDFADSGFGPLHQDFVYSAFVSPELTRLIVDRYVRISGRTIDRQRVGILIGMHRLSELAELAGDAEHVGMARDQLSLWASNIGALA